MAQSIPHESSSGLESIRCECPLLLFCKLLATFKWLITPETHLSSAFMTCRSMLGSRFKLSFRAVRMRTGCKACGACGCF